MCKLKIITLSIAILCISIFTISTQYTTIGSVNPAMANPSDSVTVYLPFILTSGYQKEPTVFGVESHKVDGTHLNRLNEVGTYWIRRNGLLWSDVQPDEFGGYDWNAVANLEQEMINASSNGMEMILVVRSTPLWAQTEEYYGIYCGPIKPEKLGAFGDFMYAAVQRYSQPPYNVKYWEMWNEPDAATNLFEVGHSVFGCWGDEEAADYGGGYYADMLQAVYPRIKQADPYAQVILGGLILDCMESNPDCLPIKFLEGILKHNGDDDGKNYFDIADLHAFDYYGGVLGEFSHPKWNSSWDEEGPVAIAKAQFVRSVLGRNGASDKGIMVNEVALLCGGDSCPPNDPEFDPDFVATKTYYIAKVYAASIAEGFQATIWYDLSVNWRNSSLLKKDLTYTDAFWAFQTAKNSLGASSWSRDIDEYPGVAGYEFDRGDRIIWLLWSLDGAPHVISLPSAPLSAWDVLNNPVSVIGSIMLVGMEPIYLEWLP